MAQQTTGRGTTQAGGMTIEQLVPGLREAFGAPLRCVLVYGSAAAGERTPRGDVSGAAGGGGDVNVLVIVDTLPLDALARAGHVMGDWVQAGHPAPLTLTSAEWRSSADVFAIEYADVIERHTVLHGTLPLEGITVRPEDIRRELEEQVLGKLLKLRRGIMEAGGDAARERTLLEVSLGTFVTLFRAVVRLHGERPPLDHLGVTERTSTLAGFDGGPFARVVRHVRGEAMLQPGDVSAVLGGYLAGLEQLIAHLDQYTPGR
jgi:hypothetical protein